MSPGLDGNQRGKYQQQEKKLLHNPKGKTTFIYQVGNSFLLWCLFFCPFSCLQSRCWHMHTDLNTWIWGRGEMRAIIGAAIPSSLPTDFSLSSTFTCWNRNGLGRDWIAPFHLLAMAMQGYMNVLLSPPSPLQTLWIVPLLLSVPHFSVPGQRHCNTTCKDQLQHFHCTTCSSKARG